MLVVWLVFLASTAYPWGFATHACLAHWLNKQQGQRDFNEMYGAMAPDMFNFRFDLPVYGDGEIYFQLHYYWQNIWEHKRTGMEKALGYGFVSHNDAWGADYTAHHAGITYGTSEGYVIAKSQELLAANPVLVDSGLVDLPTALSLCHVFVEYGLEILTTRIDPEIGDKITQAAAKRDSRFPDQLAEGFAPGFALLLEIDESLAEQVIVSNEAEFREQMMLYGQLLMLDESTVAEAFAWQLSQYVDVYGVYIPPQQAHDIILSYIQLAVILCEDDFPIELQATAKYLDTALAERGVGNRN
jgi:hypothetical protein